MSHNSIMKHRLLSLGTVTAFALSASACEPQAIDGYFTPSLAARNPSANNNGSGQDGDPFVDPPVLPDEHETTGIKNGHFDLNTSIGSNPSDNVGWHVHQYDKVNETTTVDFLHLSDKENLPQGVNAQRGGTKRFDHLEELLAPNKRFVLLFVNARLNKGGIVAINNNAPSRIMNYRTAGPFVLGNPTVPGDLKLSSLKVAFDPTIEADILLLPTAPLGCVIPNKAGPAGEYRNGALVVQAVDAENFAINPATGAASRGMLWEGIIYNHWELPDQGNSTNICYGDARNPATPK